MVFYFTASNGLVVYMGKDKFENEELLKYGFPEDVWFHVDDLSSAHVYLRMPLGQGIDDIPEDVLQECAQLVKGNSIEGSKLATVHVVYTPFENLKKGGDMATGMVGFRNVRAVRRIRVEKDKEILKCISKTKEERHPDLAAEKRDRDAEVLRREKASRRATKVAEREKTSKAKEEAALRSYDRLMDEDLMFSNTDFAATEDASAAAAYEDSFM